MATSRKKTKLPPKRVSEEVSPALRSKDDGSVKVRKPGSSQPTEQQLAILEQLDGGMSWDKNLTQTVIYKVQRVNDSAKLLRYRDVGAVILEAFFGGSFEKYQQTQGVHASYQSLLESGLKKHEIYYGIRIWKNFKDLGTALAKNLSYTHHRHLTQIRDKHEKKELAQQAVDEGWSHKKLLAAVKKLRGGKGKSPGRPPHPVFRRGVQAMVAGLRSALKGEIDELVEFYTPSGQETAQQKKKREADTKAFLAQLTELTEGLEDIRQMKEEAEQKLLAIDVDSEER